MELKKKIYKGMAVTLAFTMVPSVAMIQPTTSIAETATVAAEAPAGKMIYVTSGDETSQAGTGEEASPYQSLRYALNQANDGDTIILIKDIVYRSNNMPLFEINKNVTIDGRSHNLTIRGSHIILKKDAVLKNLSLNLLQDGSSQAKIYVNGHSLTFDGVSTKIGTNVNQDSERPVVYGGDQDGNPEGPKAVIKVINGNQESRFKKIIAGSETGDSNVPVSIIIDNKVAAVDEGIILGGETGTTTAEVTLSSNSKAAKKIDGTNSLDNSVELKDFTSYAMDLKGVQDLALKDNAYISLSGPVNVPGRLEIQAGSTLAAQSPLPNSIGILAGAGKLFVGEEANITLTDVDGTEKPTIEFSESLDDLNSRNAITPVINTKTENFDKLNMMLSISKEDVKMENGKYVTANKDAENQAKVKEVQDLYNAAKALNEQYHAAKTEAGPAVSQADADKINNAKAAYEMAYKEASDALAQLDEDLKPQVDTLGLTVPVDSATVNDSDDNSQIDDIEVNLVNGLFQLAKDAKDAYDQAKDGVGPTTDAKEAADINGKKAEYDKSYNEADTAFNKLSPALQPKVNKQNLPATVDAVEANDLDGNERIDSDEVARVNAIYRLAETLKAAYEDEIKNVGDIINPDEALLVNSRVKDYIDKYNEAEAAFEALDPQLQPQINKRGLPSKLTEVNANDRDNDGQLDTEQTKAVQKLFDDAKQLLDGYNKAKTDAGAAYSQADVDAIKAAKDAFEMKLKEALDGLNMLSMDLKPSVNPYDLAPINEALPEVNDKNNNEVVDANEADDKDKPGNNDAGNGDNGNNSGNTGNGNNPGNVDNGNNPGNADNGKDDKDKNPGNVDNGKQDDGKVNPPAKKDDNASKDKSEKDSKVIKKASMSNQASPKTGDESNVFMSLSAMIGAIGALAFMRKKKESK